MLHLLASPALILASSFPLTSRPGVCVAFDSPPTPANGWTLSVVAGQTVSFTLQASEHGCSSPLFLEGSGRGTELMVPALPLTGNPVVSSVYSWTPTVENVGFHGLSFHAVSDCCASDAWYGLTIEVLSPFPTCVNPHLGLGAAGTAAIVQLGGGLVTVQGSAGGVHGDVVLGPNARLWLLGSQYVDGAVRLSSSARVYDWSSGSVGTTYNNLNVSPEIGDALACSTVAANRACTRSFSSIRDNLTIAGNGGVNVICANEIVLTGKTLRLTGGVNDLFFVNVRGRLGLASGGKIIVQGVPKENVLINVIGTGSDIIVLGGAGGGNCCQSKIDGTLLAPYRRVWLTPGLISGEVISGSDITILLGGSIHCFCADD